MVPAPTKKKKKEFKFSEELASFFCRCGHHSDLPQSAQLSPEKEVTSTENLICLCQALQHQPLISDRPTILSLFLAHIYYFENIISSLYILLIRMESV